jgi:hypothetical protein
MSGYSDTKESCGVCFGYGDTCPLRREQAWVDRCQTYLSDDGGADTKRRLAASDKVERKYNLLHGCTTRCQGLKALRARCAAMVEPL